MDLDKIPPNFSGKKTETDRTTGVVTTYFFLMGKLHRKNNLPSVITSDESRTEWHSHISRKVHGLHREDQPAIILKDSEGNITHKEYWWEAERHNPHGPAVWDSDGTQEWWLEGEKMTEAEWIPKAQALLFRF